MFSRLTNVTNGLKYRKETYSNSDLVSKILMYLPNSWGLKVSSIQEILVAVPQKPAKALVGQPILCFDRPKAFL